MLYRKHIFTRPQHGSQYLYIQKIWSGTGLPSLMPAGPFSSCLAMTLSAIISSVPVTVSTDTIGKISSYPYIKEIMTETPKIEMFYVTAPSLGPVSSNQVI